MDIYREKSPPAKTRCSFVQLAQRAWLVDSEPALIKLLMRFAMVAVLLMLGLGSASGDGSGTGSPSCWRCAAKTPVTPIAADGSCESSDANLVQLRATLCQSIGSWPGFPDCKLPGNCSRGYPDCNAEGDWPNQ
jgi:hypothetical protein